MSKIDLGPRRDLISGNPDPDGFYGPFDADFALKVFRKLRRQQPNGRKSQMLAGLGGGTTWLIMPASIIEEAILRSPSQKYRNCKVTTEWWFDSKYLLSVWPRKCVDESLNAENNWGEEE